MGKESKEMFCLNKASNCISLTWFQKIEEKSDSCYNKKDSESLPVISSDSDIYKLKKSLNKIKAFSFVKSNHYVLWSFVIDFSVLRKHTMLTNQ